MSMDNFASDVVAVFFLWLFLQAGLHKLAPSNQIYYRQLMADYGSGFKRFAEVISPALGMLECVIGLAFLFPLSRSFAAVAAMVLLLTYFCGLAWQLYQGKKDLDCGCAGPGVQLKVSPVLLLRNGLLVLLCSVCLQMGAVSSVATGLQILAAAGVLILIYVCAEGLLANAQKIKAMRAS